MGLRNDAGLTESQERFIEALCEGKGFDEISREMKVCRSKMKKWLEEEAFINELAFKIDSCKRQGYLILARCLPAAAARLAGLMESDNAETARRACMDLVNLFIGEELKVNEAVRDEEMDGDTAAIIVRALREGRKSEVTSHK